MAGTTTPAPRPRALAHTLRHWQGRALLAWARLLQHTIAGEHRTTAHVARRNRAICAACARGVDPAALAEALGLTEGYVKSLRDKGLRE